MISDTIEFFKNKGIEVIFDAEHFFDGYKANPEYALKVLETAEKAKADYLVLCDTVITSYSIHYTKLYDGSA